MPPSAQVQVSRTLVGTTGPIRAEFVAAYNRAYSGLRNRMGGVMNFDIPATKEEETFAYFKTAPYPRLWKRGDEATFSSFESADFSVAVRDWVNGVTWHENDEEDEQTNSLVARARSAGANFATLDERVFFQILTASSSNVLLPAIPNAPDGADLYNTTDGPGADRFGISGGNIVASQTLTTAVGIRAAIFQAIERAGEFQDTEGQPLWDYDMLNSMTVFHPVANDQLMREALVAGRTVSYRAGTSTTDTSTAAGVSNIIQEAGINISLVPTQRLTGTTFYVFFDKAPHKAIFTMNRRGLRETPLDRTNSADFAVKKERGVMWDHRRGFGVFLPYQTIQVTA